MIGVAAVKLRCLERFAGIQRIRKIERVEPSRHAYLAIRGLFDGNSPVTAPGKAAEPDAAMLFAGIAGIDGKPWIQIVTRVPQPALQNLHAFVNRFAIELRFSRPSAT